jgi:hypothetical protein
MGLDLTEIEGATIDAVVKGKVAEAVNDAVQGAVESAVKKDTSES